MYVCPGCGRVSCGDEWVDVCPNCGAIPIPAENVDLDRWEANETWDAEADSLDVLNEPYPNEHAARLKAPSRYIRFRRQNNRFGRGIHAIWGITKVQKTELQSIRFTASIWSVSAAKKWLKDHGYRPIRFEPATGKKGGTEMTIEKAVSVHRPPKAPIGTKWDAAAAQKRVVAARGEKAWLQCCAWVDPNIDGVTAGKLPHHDIVNGKLCVVWAGVRAGIQVLGGARGGVKGIPTADMGGVRRHLEVHAGQFGKSVPWKRASADSMDRAAQIASYMTLLEALAARVYEKAGTDVPQNMIVEVFQPDREHFSWEEVVTDTGLAGLLRIKAMVQLADKPNKNRRIYPLAILKRETKTLNATAERGKSLSLLDHPPVSLLMIVGERLYDGVGRLTRTWIDGKEVWGEFLVEIEDNVKGRHLFSLIKTGFIPGVSSRGCGSTRSEEKDGTTFDVICDDYRLHGYDFVSNESVEGAEIKTFNREQTVEEEEDMDVTEVKAIVDESITAALSGVEGKLDVLQSDEFVSKGEHEHELSELNSEIASRGDALEALKRKISERETEITALKADIEKLTPPEALTENALKEKVANDEPYRDEVLKALSFGYCTVETFDARLEAARKFVTELLSSKERGEVHGEMQEREAVGGTEEPPETNAGEAIFRKRGQEISEDLKGTPIERNKNTA